MLLLTGIRAMKKQDEDDPHDDPKKEDPVDGWLVPTELVNSDEYDLPKLSKWNSVRALKKSVNAGKTMLPPSGVYIKSASQTKIFKEPVWFFVGTPFAYSKIKKMVIAIQAMKEQDDDEDEQDDYDENNPHGFGKMSALARHVRKQLGKQQQLAPGDLKFRPRATVDGWKVPTELVTYYKFPDLTDWSEDWGSVSELKESVNTLGQSFPFPASGVYMKSASLTKRFKRPVWFFVGTPVAYSMINKIIGFIDFLSDLIVGCKPVTYRSVIKKLEKYKHRQGYQEMKEKVKAKLKKREEDCAKKG